jgi:hypothetical protein
MTPFFRLFVGFIVAICLAVLIGWTRVHPARHPVLLWTSVIVFLILVRLYF